MKRKRVGRYRREKKENEIMTEQIIKSLQRNPSWLIVSYYTYAG